MRPTAVIIDDEPLARETIRDYAARLDVLELVAEAGDGESAVRIIDEHQPDIVFLDIEIPPPSGLEVLERIHSRPAVIFTTAYDRYAVAAFEIAAVDYLLKPFDLERFRLAVDRALEAIGQSADAVELERLRETLDADRPLGRIFVRDRGRILPVTTNEIVRLEARRDYVAIHTASRHYLLRTTLRELEARLDAHTFLRVHRSHIVNLDYVTAFNRHDADRYRVELSDGTTIVASRSHSAALRKLTG